MMLSTAAPRLVGRSGGGAVAAAAPRLLPAAGSLRRFHALPAASVAAHALVRGDTLGRAALLGHRWAGTRLGQVARSESRHGSFGGACGNPVRGSSRP